MAFDDYLKQSGGGDVPGTGSNQLNITSASAAYGISQDLAVIPVKFNGETRHVLDVLNHYSSWDEQHLAQVQHMLVDAGYLRGTKGNPIVYGQDTDASLQAYEQAVLSAARKGTSVTEVLENAARMRREQGIAPGDTGDANAIRLTNPDDLRAVATQTYNTLTGADPEEGWIQNFIHSFQGNEQKAGVAANGSGTFTDAPNPQAAAIAATKRDHPGAVKARSEGKAIDDFRKLVQDTKDNAS